MAPLFVRLELLTSIYVVGDPTTDARIHTHCPAVVCLQTTRRGHFDDENERCSALKQSQRSKNLSVITAKYTTTSITKDISKPGRLTNKNAVLL